MADSRRPRRVAEQIRAYIGAQLSRTLEDPRLAGLVITDVKLPADLGGAWVKFVLLVGDDDPRMRRHAVASVKGAAGKLRKGLGQHLKLKRVPELRFEYDVGPEAQRNVQKILDEVGPLPSAAEDEPGPEGS